MTHRGDQLIIALWALKDRAHLVLANGSVQTKKGEPAAKARLHDENEDIRKRLMAKD